jgi:hypothetical protein
LPCTQSPTHTSRIIPVPIQTLCTQASGGDGIGAAGRAEHLTGEYKDGSLWAAPQRRRHCWEFDRRCHFPSVMCSDLGNPLLLLLSFSLSPRRCSWWSSKNEVGEEGMSEIQFGTDGCGRYFEETMCGSIFFGYKMCSYPSREPLMRASCCKFTSWFIDGLDWPLIGP